MDIFSGANLKVEIGTAGTVVSTTFETVPEVASFTTSGFESAVIEVVTFNSAYNRKLLGTKSVPDIELNVNLLRNDEVQQKLETAADLHKRIQVRLSYYEDATHTTGFYVVYNCLVSSTIISGDKDVVITKKFNLVVDDGAVASGVLPLVGE
ncbi:hypothetical protein [Serratia liquefaciens]|uniref:hypothetical protein n=1 Tax=Serratia liquefaciens TaxID=614 RepID=UPI00372BCA93